MHFKTLMKDGTVALRDYDPMETAVILTERNSYVLKAVHKYGNDYGGCQNLDISDEEIQEIIPERVLVRDGHFCGALVQTAYFSGDSDERYFETVLLAEDGRRGSARGGFYYSSDDHDRWDYTDYYLEPAPKADI